MSVSEYVEKQKEEQRKKNPEQFKTVEEQEFEIEMQKIDREVAQMIQHKKKDFSFEILDELVEHPEIKQVSDLIEKGIENYKMFKRVGQIEDAKEIKQKIKEMKFAKEHLTLVMNLDFTRPTQKMKDMAENAGIDLKDPKIIEEFKIIQNQNLTDIQRLRDGKQPLSEEELKKERAELLVKL